MDDSPPLMTWGALSLPIERFEVTFRRSCFGTGPHARLVEVQCGGHLAAMPARGAALLTIPTLEPAMVCCVRAETGRGVRMVFWPEGYEP